jgi:hypothetical protein
VMSSVTSLHSWILSICFPIVFLKNSFLFILVAWGLLRAFRWSNDQALTYGFG